MTIEDVVKSEIAAAMHHYMNVMHVWPQVWLDCFYDPTLSHEENCELAWQAVQSGWRP